jgi:hypothetical protein
MAHCRSCGGKLRRVHRTITERIFLMAVFECPQCKEVRKVPRRFTYHLGKRARCPKCGTYRLRALAHRDHIDSMQRGLLNWLSRMFGGRLYHCRYCRLQFYDRRKLADPEVVAGGSTKEPEP